MQIEKQKRAEKLRELRKKCGLSQAAVAAALDVKPQSVQKYEYAETEPTASGWLTLARLFGVDVGELIDPDKKPEPIPPGCVLVPVPVEYLKKLNF